MIEADMKRSRRFLWILATNGLVASFTFARLSAALSDLGLRDPQILFEVVVEIVLPISGIILEAANQKLAKWVNTGYLAVAGAFWLISGANAHSDPFSGVLLINGFGMLFIGVITLLSYRPVPSKSDAPRFQ
jgi:hypothetical protein